MRALYQTPDGNWNFLQEIPGMGYGDDDSYYIFAFDGEEIEWNFRFSLYGNNTWPIRIVAYVTEGGNDPWVELVVRDFSVNATGHPDFFADSLYWDHDVAWKENSFSHFLANDGDGIAKSYFWTMDMDGASYMASRNYGPSYEDWMYPNVEGWATFWAESSPDPGVYEFTLNWHVAGESYADDNVTSTEETFTNQSLLMVSDFFGVDLPTISSPTFGLAARNHGPERGMDWWYCWIYSAAEDQWSDGDWMEVDFVDPNGQIFFTRSLPNAHLAQGWHYINMWSHYHEGRVYFEDDTEAWFYVPPTQSPELIMEDTNSQAGGVRRDGPGNVLRMVREDGYDRAANIDLDFSGLSFSYGYPKWSFNYGGNPLYLSDGNPFGSYFGDQSSSFSAQWTGGDQFVDGLIEIVPKEPWQIHFSTDGIQGFIGAVNFTIEQLGGGSDRFHLVGAVGGSSENVNHYNDGSEVSRKWLFDGNFGFKLDAIEGLESPAVTIPAFPLVSVWAELDVGNLDATVDLPGFGYDPSRANPWSHPVGISASTDFKAKLAFGRELCSYEVAIKGGGSTSVAMDGLIDPRQDGIYLTGNLEFGAIVATIEINVEGPFGCNLETVADVVLLDPTSISLSDSTGIKIYSLE